MRTLIINADDFGADLARTAGILEAVDANIVTSVSMLANGLAFTEAAAGIRERLGGSLSAGLHLNLSEGTPLSRNLRHLVNETGQFRGKSEALSFLEMAPSEKMGEELREELTREITAQVERLLEAGITITHLDGHQHVHVFPAVVEAALGAAETFAIPWIRIADEQSHEPATHDPFYHEALRFQGHAARARKRIASLPLRTTDHFRGLYLKGRVDLSTLTDTLEGLPEGVTELMVHPGRVPVTMSPGSFGSFATSDRERELEALMDERFRSRLAELGIRLASFAEL